MKSHSEPKPDIRILEKAVSNPEETVEQTGLKGARI